MMVFDGLKRHVGMNTRICLQFEMPTPWQAHTKVQSAMAIVIDDSRRRLAFNANFWTT